MCLDKMQKVKFTIDKKFNIAIKHDWDQTVQCISIKPWTLVAHDERINIIDFQGQRSELKVMSKCDYYSTIQ